MDLFVTAYSVPDGQDDAIPVTGTAQFLTNGDPTSINKPASVAPAYWFNQLARNIQAIIQGCGMTPSRLATNQIWLALKGWFAPIASPALTGIPQAPTAAAGTSTTQLATTAFVAAAIKPLPAYGALAIGGSQENYTTLSSSGTETITLTFTAPIKGRVQVTSSANFSGQVSGTAELSVSCNGATGSADNVAYTTGITNVAVFEVQPGAVSVASYVGVSATGSAAVGHTLAYLFFPE